MQKRSLDLSLIGYGLSIVYSLGLLFYLWAYIYSWLDPQNIMRSPLIAHKFKTIAELQNYVYILWALYFPQVVGLVAVTMLQEWGRKIVVTMNVVMCLLILFKALLHPSNIDFVSMMSILIYIVLILYFIQPRIKEQFQGSSPLMNKRILVIDDDRGLLKLIKSNLTPQGFDILTAATGEHGLKLARSKRPVLIILDVILPGLKGRDVCAILKDDPETRKIPVIFLTAKDSPDDVKAEIAVGGITHITKPINTQKLLTEIKKIIGF